MKKRRLILSAMLFMGLWMVLGMKAQASVTVDATNFPDDSVRVYANYMDKDKDGVLSDAELQAPTEFLWDVKNGVRENDVYGAKAGSVVDFKGMELFTNIKSVTLKNVGTGAARWNYADSDLMKYFPNAVSLFMHSYMGTSADGGAKITLTGTSDRLEQLSIVTSWLVFDFDAQNMSTLDVRSSVLEKSKFNSEKFPALTDLVFSCREIKNCDLSFKGFKLLKKLQLYCMYLKNLQDNGVVLSQLSELPIESMVLSSNVEGTNFSMTQISSSTVKDLTISMNIGNAAFNVEGFPALESLVLRCMECSNINLTPVKKTLKKLSIGVALSGDEYACTFYSITNPNLKKLDISQMECLEELDASYTAIKELITKDASGKANTGKMKKIYLYNSKIKTVDVSAMPKLEELYVGNNITKLNVKKNKKLKTLWIKGNQLKTLNLKNNKQLFWLKIEGKQLKSLDLSKNTSLCRINLKGKMKMKKIILPMLKSSAYVDDGWYSYNGVSSIDTMDLSKVKKLTKKSKKHQITASVRSVKYKKIIISKKLKKSHKKWIKDWVKKKTKAKIVVK